MATNGEALVLTSGPSAITPMQLLEMAMSQNADLEKLKQLMDLQERWEKNEARKAFVEAMNAFKRNPPTILKNHTVSFGETTYKHATLDHVVKEVTEALSAHGISHRWTVKQDKDWITVTCVLTHQAGHSEETTLMGAPDNSGKKNSIQQIGSTVTYLQRYTLLAATGLAASNNDDDGRGAGPEPESSNTKERVADILKAQSADDLKERYMNAYREAHEHKDEAAKRAYIAAKDQRKKELGHAAA